MIIREGLALDDVLLVPKYSDIDSRSSVDLNVNIKDIVYNHPIIPANMQSITGEKMALAIAKSGGLALIHRFMPIEDQLKLASSLNFRSDIQYIFNYIGFSVGVGEPHKESVKKFSDLGVKIFCIDIAHGDSKHCVLMTEWIRKNYPESLIISGNVATGSGARRLWDNGADVVKNGIGGGCFAAGTRILMSNGTYKNIENIKPGDRVINKNGKPKTVLKAFSTGTRNVSKIRNSIFYKDTYVTPDHKYFIGDLSSVSKASIEAHGYANILKKQSKTSPKQDKLKWQEIGSSDRVALLMPRHIEFEIPSEFKETIFIRSGGNGYSSIKEDVDCILEPNYNVGYIFGTFLGDGHSMLANNGKTDTGAIHWYFGKNEQDIANKLKNCVKIATGRDLKTEEKNNIIFCSLYDKPLAEFLFIFGKKTNKHLPEHLIVNNKEYLQGLLDGLIDSDGNIEKNNRINFTNTSTELIELFNVIIYLLTGVFPNNQKCKISTGNLKNANIDNFNTPYRARINLSAEKRLIDDYQISKLLEYSEIDNNVEVFDLTIDCETHSFIADNAIVHNSLCSTRIETGNGVAQLTALMDVAKERDFYCLNKKVKKYIISDGGIKNAGDITKCLCFADMVMTGNVFSGSVETPGSILEIQGKSYKEYRGSSTHKANHIEGVVAIVPTKGKFENILKKLLEGVRSGCSYQGAHNLTELKDNPEFIKITSAGMTESKPHDVIF